MTPERVKLAREMYESARYTVAAIAKNLAVSRPTINKHLQIQRDRHREG
jgi:predicted transcriptional regulator